MSRTPTNLVSSTNLVSPTTVTTAQQIPNPPPGLELSPVPNIRMAASAAEWIRANLGIAVTDRYIKVQTEAKQIPYFLIHGVRHYSSQDLYDFIMTRRKVVSQ